MVAASGTKLIHQMPDKLGADIVNINDKLKENVKDIGELNQSIQMSQEKIYSSPGCTTKLYASCNLILCCHETLQQVCYQLNLSQRDIIKRT